MYRLQVKFRGEWKWSINDYSSIEEAENRVCELKKVGIRARVVSSEKLYN